MKILATAICHKGLVRTNNEDMILVNGNFLRDNSFCETFILPADTLLAFVVADGMGGHNGGEIASELALKSFDNFILNLPDNLDTETLKQKIDLWVKTIHSEIIREGTTSPEFNGMGTTFTGIFTYQNRFFTVHVGDSRLYRFRNSILKQLTTDHSMRELTGNPDTPSNLIYNSIGAGDDAFADINDITESILNGDKFLICSDGLTDMLDDDAICRLLEEQKSPSDIASEACNEGGKDNISVLLLEVEDVVSQIIDECPEDDSDSNNKGNDKPKNKGEEVRRVVI